MLLFWGFGFVGASNSLAGLLGGKAGKIEASTSITGIAANG